MGDERRRFIRAPMRLTTFYTIVGSGKTRRALTKDISGGGLRLITETLLEPAAQLKIEMTLPDDPTPITFDAQVAWSRPVDLQHPSAGNPTAETGITIVKINSKAHTLLKQYAALNAPPKNS